MLKSKSLQQTEATASVRVLKIDAEGDAWKGLIKPKIRLIGRWLSKLDSIRADKLKSRVAPGLIELRSRDGSTASEISAITSDQATGSVWCGDFKIAPHNRCDLKRHSGFFIWRDCA